MLEFIDRKVVYAMVLAWYYTFSVIYSVGIGFTDVLLSTAIISALSYLWILRWAAKRDPEVNFDYKDIFINVFVYTFVSFYIALMSLVLSGKDANMVRLTLLVSPIAVWVGIWTDYYFQKIQGRM